MGVLGEKAMRTSHIGDLSRPEFVSLQAVVGSLILNRDSPLSNFAPLSRLTPLSVWLKYAAPRRVAFPIGFKASSVLFDN